MTDENENANAGEKFDITPEERDQIEKQRTGGDKPIKEEDRVATVADIDKSLQKQEQARADEQSRSKVRGELDEAVNGPIEADERLQEAKPHQLDNIRREAFQRVRQLPNRAAMSGDDLKKELAKAAKTIIDEEFEFHGTKQTEQKKADLDKRLEAAAKAGEGGGDAGDGARSAGEGSSEAKASVGGIEVMECGPFEQKQPLPSDGEVSAAFEKEADRYLAAHQ